MVVQAVLVTGAHGRIGASIINALSLINDDNRTIYGLSRDANSGKSIQLARSKRVKVIEGDLAKPDLVFGQIGQMLDTLILILPGMSGTYKPEKLGNMAWSTINAAQRARVKHIILYNIESSLDAKSTIAQMKRAEVHLNATINSNLDMQYTIIRPGILMDHFLPGHQGRMYMTELHGSIGADTRVPFICVSDVGTAVAQVALVPEEFQNTRIRLYAEYLTAGTLRMKLEERAGDGAGMTYCCITRKVCSTGAHKWVGRWSAKLRGEKDGDVFDGDWMINYSTFLASRGLRLIV